MQVDLPKDVLVIHYTTIAPGSSPLVRLQVLAAIGRLLAAQDQSHAIDDLVRDTQPRAALQNWLESEEASRFWQYVNDQVVPIQVCEKHILVGTRHLLDDLSVLMSQSPQPQLTSLDMLWQAASVFVNQHLNRENNLRGVE